MKYPYKNTTYNNVNITKVQDGFYKEATFIINPPTGYTLTPVLTYKIERLEQGSWLLSAILTPNNSKYRFLPGVSYRVTATFDSSMMELTSNSFEVTPVSTYAKFEEGNYYYDPFSLSSQTVNPTTSTYNVQFVGNLIYSRNTDNGSYSTSLVSAHQTINPANSIYTVQFVGNLSYSNLIDSTSYNTPLTFSHQTTNPTFSSFSPQFVGSGGV
jgi:hypothetical protein